MNTFFKQVITATHLGVIGFVASALLVQKGWANEPEVQEAAAPPIKLERQVIAKSPIPIVWMMDPAAKKDVCYRAVSEAVGQFWKLYAKRDWPRTYLLETAGTREHFPPKNYMGMMHASIAPIGITLFGPEYLEQDKVSIRVEFEYANLEERDRDMPKTSQLTYNWLKEHGKWRRDLRHPLIRP